MRSAVAVKVAMTVAAVEQAAVHSVPQVTGPVESQTPGAIYLAMVHGVLDTMIEEEDTQSVALMQHSECQVGQ